MLKRKLRILIADDEKFASTLLQGILSEFGECELASDGHEALFSFENNIKKKIRYDLICLDIQMPIVDGHSALKKIRNLELKYKIPQRERTKILMITSKNATDSGMYSIENQCDGYITKPANYSVLVQKLKEFNLIGNTVKL